MDIEGGNAFSGAAFGSGNIRIARITEVSQQREVEEWAYLEESEYNKFEKKSLIEADVLLVGTHHNKHDLGNVFQIKESCQNNTFNQRVFRLRFNKDVIDPYYSFISMRTKYVRFQIERLGRGNNQLNLNLPELNKIKIPFLSIEFQKRIGLLVKRAYSNIDDCSSFYKSALQLLLKNLEIQNWQPTDEPKAIISFSKSFGISGRLDAEYYQPKYDELMQIISEVNHKTLGSISTFKKSIEPGSDAYLTEGIPFIRVSDISKFGLSHPEIHLDRAEFDIDLLKPKKDTILLSKDGSVGIAYKVEQDLDVITSSALLHLTITDTEVLPDYLTLVLNSKLTQMQAERDAGGSIIQHWRPDEIKQVLIPILPMDIQKELSKQIKQSFKLRQESTKLIDIAKQAVEIAIEQNVNAAIDFIHSNT